jgi:NADH dehydrogenase/NADH:ubiquinone oxidoreductase subunit G
MEMETKTSICPGCSIGCGLYLLQAEEGEERKIKILHRPTSPMNEGKLCKFGTDLHMYYEREVLNNSVDGKEVKQEEAIREAKERLKGIKPDELAFIALPSTITNEEILSFASVASEFGCENVSFGFERFFREIQEEASYIIECGLPFSEVEKASKIILFFLDPFVHYPLLARRILKAKKNGARVIEVSFAKNERKIADEAVLVGPMEVRRIKEKKEMFADSLIIGELTPYTNSQFLALMLWLTASTSSKLFLLKPFLNSTGAFLLGRNGKETGKRKDLVEILDEIERGEIKALYLLETDLVGAMLGGEEVAETISKLDLLIEQNAFRTPLSDIANITISSEPFFMKKGTIVNIEGRLLDIGGESEKGLQAMESMGKGRSYEEVHEKVKRKLGLSEINEFEIAVKREEKSFEMAEPKVEIEERKGGEGYFLWYKTNPFFWNGIQSKNFVEISPVAMRKLGLFRGDEVEVVQGERKERMGFKISELSDYLILSEAKMSIGEKMLTRVEMKRAGE